MLVVEGPDGVGKTTLCKRLLKELPRHVYAHFTRLPRGFDYYWGYADRMSRFIVQDRFHMSEWAYAAARMETPKLCEDGYRLVDANLRLLGGFTVLVTADPDVVAGRWDPSQMFSLEATLGAAAEYLAILGRPGYRPDVDFHFHATKDKPYVPDDAVDEILRQYQSRQFLVDCLARDKPGRL